MSEHGQASSTNIYAAPTASLTQETDVSSYQPAGRGRRFAAAFIDDCLQFAILGVSYYLILRYSTGFFQQAGKSWIPFVLIGPVVAFITFLLLNGKFLSENGQTIGKLICSIRIVRTDGGDAGLWHILLRRYAPVLALALIPTIGWAIRLIDALFIFQASRKCLHDLLADTVVVVKAKK
jgi:uncharacterized RDD family membrane protein YckC